MHKKITFSLSAALFVACGASTAMGAVDSAETVEQRLSVIRGLVDKGELEFIQGNKTAQLQGEVFKKDFANQFRDIDSD